MTYNNALNHFSDLKYSHLKPSNSTFVNISSQETSNTVTDTTDINNTDSLEAAAKASSSSNLNLPQIELVNTLELISKHMYKLQAFDFKYKDTSTKRGSCSAQSREHSADSSSLDTTHDIPVISGKQAKRLSRKLAKSKKNLSDPNLSVVMPCNLETKAINSEKINSRSRKKFLNMSALSSFLKCLLRKTPKSNTATKLDKKKSKSFDNIISSRNGFDENSPRKSTQPSIEVGEMVIY